MFRPLSTQDDAILLNMRIWAMTLTTVYFLLSFNAYACLVPLYGGIEVMSGSDCSMPQEEPARQQCDAFKSLGIQGVPSVDPVSHLSHTVLGALSALPVHEPLISVRVSGGSGPPVFIQDPLARALVLRL
jgi:hypothetical protein